ncbi:spermatogenic leucine zipper protein 1 [Cynocephalus volans]|uniref:spermatogenic leucine zipper protein 1 n=1 Tax=Cynocephalus volans TaxID=110931 RepID=UPI002FCB8B5F
MARPASTAEIPTLSQTLNPTLAAHQESLDPRIIIALFEIGSLPPLCWDSLPSPKNSSHQVTEQESAQKFENLLKEIKDILKDVAGFGEKITEAKESFEEIYISEDVSELKEKIRELGKINKMLLKNLLISLGPEKEQNAKKQEMSGKHLENQNSKNMVKVLRKDVVNHSEEKRVPNETQLNEEKAKYGFLPVQEESIKLRNNMEQLLQEAEHWSKQHTELSELIKLYQKSQTDVQETFENSGDYFQTQPNNEVSGRHELEEQVRILRIDTYSLHLIAALLENECQILQQRVEILKELRYQKEQTLQEKPIQVNYEQNKKEQEPSEAEKAENYKQSIQETEGTFQKKDRFYRSLDVCLNKKARNNWFNTRIARRARMGKKRPSSSLR